MPNISWNIVFFPGTIFHELAHYLACVLVGVKVQDVKLFDVREAYVEHEISNPWQAIIISTAPFLVGNAVGFLLLQLAGDLFLAADFLAIVFYWLAISLIFYSFPSKADAMNAFNSVLQFYKNKLFSGKIISRLIWFLLLPFIFLPLVILTGLLLVFDYSHFLKLLWLLALLFISLQGSVANIFI